MAVDSGYRDDSPGPQIAEPVSFLFHHEIEQFLYHEARMLDDRRFEEWFELLADDIRYVMPTRYNRLKREADREFAAPNEAQLFDAAHTGLSRMGETPIWEI